MSHIQKRKLRLFIKELIMDKRTLEILCCPFDKADLTLHTIEQTVEGNIVFGYFNCTSCQRIYPIISGIPIMTPDEYRDVAFEKNVYQLLEAHIDHNLQISNFRLLPKA